MTYEAWDRRTVTALCLVTIGTVAVSAWAEMLVAALVVAFDVFVLVAGLGVWAVWGRDPSALDDDSVLAAGPPAGLTPCLAVIVHDGRAEDRAMRGSRGHGDSGKRARRDSRCPLFWGRCLHPTGVGRRQGQIAASACCRDDRFWAARTYSGRGPGCLPEGAPSGWTSWTRSWQSPRLGRTSRLRWTRELVSAAVVPAPAVSHDAGVGGGLAEVAFMLGVVGTVVAILVASAPLLLFAYAGLVFVGLFGQWVALAMRLERGRERLLTAMLKAYRRSLAKTLGVGRVRVGCDRCPEFAWFQTPDQDHRLGNGARSRA